MLNTSVNENCINVFPRFYTPKVVDAHHVVAYHSTTVIFTDIKSFTVT